MGRTSAPSVRGLPEELARAAREIAERLGAAGHRAWIVGGAPRNLALGAPVVDLDMTSSAHPDEVEELFARTIAVGRAFGTLIVLVHDEQVQLTTFRSEDGYTDRRHPDRVEYGSTLEEDARRRDFTCNAIYLDPLTDEIEDPEGGLEDLRQGRLRCVGDPRDRFREDGLRLVRMARFAAAYDLEVEPSVLAAARERVGSLAGVSAERVHHELELLFERPGTARALELLAAQELLGPMLFGVDAEGASASGAWAERPATARNLASLGAVGEAPGFALGMALLLAPEHHDDGARAEDRPGRRALERLRPSRAQQDAVLGIWSGLAELESLLADEASGERSRARRILLVRGRYWPSVARAARAQRAAAGRDAGPVEELERFAMGLDRAALFPAALLSSDDLAACGIERGPLWGEILREVERLQLDQRLAGRDDALAWLARRAQQVG